MPEYHGATASITDHMRIAFGETGGCCDITWQTAQTGAGLSPGPSDDGAIPDRKDLRKSTSHALVVTRLSLGQSNAPHYTDIIL